MDYSKWLAGPPHFEYTKSTRPFAMMRTSFLKTPKSRWSREISGGTTVSFRVLIVLQRLRTLVVDYDSPRIMEELERLSLVSKVCSELDNHFGIKDKDVAEFIIELATISKTFDKFKRALAEEDLENRQWLPALAMPNSNTDDMMDQLESLVPKWKAVKDENVEESETLRKKSPSSHQKETKG
ncbi:hypothetical protein KIN20_028655 [Parelaphostrongylus tenuis]|uniref:Uncharacterized protein n=1 Tax=Parelaphostrongylus tenuis TaxID=148309 RepID=A0AAD5R169_PARTN|nr:hypothetical protein KIN20_028655 [Parelaphostrongylus tenuis]